MPHGIPAQRVYLFTDLRHIFCSDLRWLDKDNAVVPLNPKHEPVITPGGPGAFDEEYVGIIRDLVPFGQDRIGIFYHGTRFPHKYPRWPHVLEAFRGAWAYWPKGRLAAVRSEEEGRFFTFPLEVKGRALRLNARMSKSGEIRVEIVDTPGRSIAECNPIVGDGGQLPVLWHGNDTVGLPDGQPITLEFSLRSADLFGFEWV